MSYNKPRETIITNTVGTSNILDISKDLKNLKSLVIITSDKCYLNKEFKKGYKETDVLGGTIYTAPQKLALKLFLKHIQIL